MSLNFSIDRAIDDPVGFWLGVALVAGLFFSASFLCKAYLDFSTHCDKKQGVAIIPYGQLPKCIRKEAIIE